MITSKQLVFKRAFDLVLSVFLLPVLIVPIVLLIILSIVETKAFGIFVQQRVGQFGRPFQIYKIRTLNNDVHQLGHLEKAATPLGRLIRRYKLDELPQLFNVILGQMSFVGPRPDLFGFADLLEGEDRIILKVKPGITGPATLKYRHEEKLLSQQKDPELYNRLVIWKDKVEINKHYVQNWSFSLDLKLIIKSIKAS
ncbi:sugar transferase [Sediminibacter sp. Hel_I_10]|uniref:sugar transferase n=1 Tax=Sediminibacter sp. Hel_I_10 TaxID=1392490 RepID=UPI000478A730|nr:sugar transferase [Sediminibacter sp. Hel_I_10]